MGEALTDLIEILCHFTDPMFLTIASMSQLIFENFPTAFQISIWPPNI